jgi:DNA polymerase I-like protein with 3'-5' exonuclease and polymerase domains
MTRQDTPQTPRPLSADELAGALEAARGIARLGIPLFVAPPDPSSSTGFALPTGWQHTGPDASVPDRWQPGWALCAVMGHGLDVLDVDPRNGGAESLAQMNGTLPTAYGSVATPSGGGHLWINSLGVAKATNVLPGIDIQAGAGDGHGRGFVFLPPTVRVSKVDGVARAYRWAGGPDLGAWELGWRVDNSGEALRQLMAAASGGPSMARAPENVPAGWLAMERSAKAPQAERAAQSAMAEKLTAVAEHDRAGGFRDVLMRAALTLGGYVGGGYLTEADAAERLRGAVAACWGAPDEADELWMAQGLADGAQRPFYVYTPAQEAQWMADGGVELSEDVLSSSPLDTPLPPPPWSVLSAIGAHPFEPSGTDQAHAEAVLMRMRPALLWSESSATWLARSAERWLERHDRAGWAVSMVARLMPAGVVPRPKDKEDWTREHWASYWRDQYMSSAGSAKITRKVKDITRDDRAPWSVDVAELDQDPEVLWAGGWPWSLSRSLEVPTVADWVDPNTPHMHTASVIPAPGPTPVWDAFLAAVWPDPEIRAWAVRVLAISLTGYPDAALPVLYGRERSGKSSVIGLLCRVLGTYGIAADARLLAGADQAHASIIYALKGCRLAFVDEGPRRGHLATERLKQITGGIPLTGNPMRGNPVTFAPTHTLVLTSNDEPPITDPALRARMRMVPCEALEADIRPLRQQLARPVTWAAEAPGILAALMTEAAGWLADRDSASNHRAPLALIREAEEMVAQQSPVSAWVAERTTPAQPGTPGRQLFIAYASWLESHPLYRRTGPGSETAFGRALTDLGHPAAKLDGRWYRPLSVTGGTAMDLHGGGGAPGGFGGSGAGLQPQPATPQNASSNGISSNSSGGLAGISRPISLTTHNTSFTTPNGVPTQHYTEKIEAAPPIPPESSPRFAADLGQPARAGTDSVLASEPPSSSADTNYVSLTNDPPAPATDTQSVTGAAAAELEDIARRAGELGLFDPPAKVTARTDTGRVSVDKKRIAAEAKAAARLVAIAAAEGAEVTLPAAVNRAGAITEITTDEALTAGRCILERSGSLTLDVEHTGYALGRDEYALRLVQLGDEDLALVLDPTSAEQRAVVTALVAEAPRLCAHSATADLNPLAWADMIAIESGWYRMWDTVIPAKLGDPRSTGSDPDLKSLGAKVLGPAGVSKGADEAREGLFKAGGWLTKVKPETPLERSGWAQVKPNSSTMVRYAAADVLDTAALDRRLPTIPAPIMHRERAAQEMTARISYRGLPLDAELHRGKVAEHTALMAQAMAEITGYRVENPKSSQQLAAGLERVGYRCPRTKPSGKFPQGQASTADHVLQVLKRDHPDTDAGRLASLVIDWRHSDTVINLFLKPYGLLINNGDGRARPTIYTLSADTGRMSSVRPNCQQLPKTGGIRALYRADEGHVLIKADFAGVELRGAGALSGDQTMLAKIAEADANTDPDARVNFHWMIAKQAFGPDATKADYYAVKPGVFGHMYGGGIVTLAQQIGVNEQTMAAIVDSLKALTPQFQQWSNDLRQAVRRGQTHMVSYSGRVIHFPPAFPHKAPNYAIQGSCRELLVDALLRWRETRWGHCTLMPVHDELIIQVPEEDGAEATAALVECMQGNLFGVPIIAEPDEPSPFWTDST